MHPDLEALLVLQDADVAVTSCDARLKALEPEVQTLDEQVAAAERIVAAIPFASDDEKANLAHEKQRLAAERNAKRPTYGIIQSARRKGAPGS
ncbi:MAG: hypothetical protein AUG85_10570 [Gemmatimonadetes bacterium 13_1_20CM_4_66_11]|nr:MAG: hypothetical protein AUG85_10570 [Gemmatimonadetes bacterium 13_1_20CM_4_66_11]